MDRDVLQTIVAIEEALGERLTPQRSLIIANIGRRLRHLALLEAFEAELGTIGNVRMRAVTLLTESIWKLLDSIERSLERIGLDRTARKAASLADIVASFGKASVEPEIEPVDANDTPEAGATETQDDTDGETDTET